MRKDPYVNMIPRSSTRREKQPKTEDQKILTRLRVERAFTLTVLLVVLIVMGGLSAYMTLRYQEGHTDYFLAMSCVVVSGFIATMGLVPRVQHLTDDIHFLKLEINTRYIRGTKDQST